MTMGGSLDMTGGMQFSALFRGTDVESNVAEESAALTPEKGPYGCRYVRGQVLLPSLSASVQSLATQVTDRQSAKFGQRCLLFTQTA